MNKIKKRIAIFLSYLGGGGAERVMLNLARGLIEHGLDVDIVVSQTIEPSNPHQWRIPSGARVVNLQATSEITSLLGLTRYLKRDRPFSLLSALHFTNEIAILAKYLACVPTRIIVSEHNTLSQSLQKKNKGLRHRLLPKAIQSFYPWADGIVAVSRGAADALAEVGKLQRDRIKVIYNPVITPEIVEQEKEPIDHPWLQPGEPPVILGVGKIEPQKDFPTLIRAFARVRAVRRSRLMILGWGPDIPQIEALIDELDIKDDIALLGYQTNPFPYMARAAVFVLSSAWEGLPTVLIEAMAVNTPVVSTNCESGPSEILDNGRYGFLAPVGDDEAISQAILNVLDGDIKTVDPTWLNQFTLETATQEYLKYLNADCGTAASSDLSTPSEATQPHCKEVSRTSGASR